MPFAFLAVEEKTRDRLARVKVLRLLMKRDAEPAHLRRFQEPFTGEVLVL